MSQEDTITIGLAGAPRRDAIHPDAFELRDLIGGFDGPVWRRMSADLEASGVPRCEGDGDGGGDGTGAGEGGTTTTAAPPPGGDADDDRVTKANKEAQRYRTELRATQKKVEELEAQGLSEAEKLKKEAAEGVKRGETGTQKLRQANLIVALAEKGLTGGRAKAAAKLLDVDFDDDDEPKDLDKALKAGAEAYGEDVFSTEAQPRIPVPRGPQSGGRQTSGGMDALIRRQAGR